MYYWFQLIKLPLPTKPLTMRAAASGIQGHCFRWTVAIQKIKEPLEVVPAPCLVKRAFLMGVGIWLVVPVASCSLQQLFIPLQFLTVRVSALLNFSPLLHSEPFNWAGLESQQPEWTALPFKMLSKRIIGFSNGDKISFSCSTKWCQVLI